MTTPASNLGVQQQSALSANVPSGKGNSPITVTLGDRTEDEIPRPIKQEPDISRLIQSPLLPNIWPFADRKGNPQTGPLVSVKVMSSADNKEVGRELTPQVEQQEELTTSLRPSKSLSSLKLVPQRQGLIIPPGAVMSQSSEVFAQGEVSSPAHKAETHEQPISKQTIEEQGHDLGLEHRPASRNDRESHPVNPVDNIRAAPGHGQDLTSLDNNQEAGRSGTPAQDDLKQSSKHVNRDSHISDSTPVHELKDSREVISIPAANNTQSSASMTVHAAVQPTGPHSWPLSTIHALESATLHQTPGNSPIALPVPIIRVQQTTESEEMPPPSECSAARLLETRLETVQRPISKAFADESHISASALTSSSPVGDGLVPSPATSSLQQAATVPEQHQSEARSAISPLGNQGKDTMDHDYPGFTKLAVRKARNLAEPRFVLSILLGRQLAERTKPHLQELARPSIWKPGKPVSAGACEFDRIAELERELGFLRRECSGGKKTKS